MPMVYQQNINSHTRLGVWHITEPEHFFTEEVPLQRAITHPHKRLQHLAGRFILKELFPGFPHALIKIADTRKPFLEDEAYHFSISHAGDYAAAMVSTADRVGVDVELISSKAEKVKHKFLSGHEQALIQELSGNDFHSHQTLITAAWSIKESLYKWFGDGEIDFIEHLHIENIQLNDNSGAADCIIRRSNPAHLTVHFLQFNGNCLSWVMS